MDDGIVKDVLAVSKSEAEKAIVPLTSAVSAEVKKAVTAEGKTMTVKEVADAMGVSMDTVRNCIHRIMPGKIQNGKTTFLNEQEVALVSKELKNNNAVTDRITFEVSSKVKNTTTAMEIKQNYYQATRAYVEMLETENTELRGENSHLTAENVNWQITFDEAKEWASVKRMQTLNPGKEFPWRALKDFSLEHGYDIQKVYDKNYGKVNAYYSEVWEAVYGGQISAAPWFKQEEV